MADIAIGSASDPAKHDAVQQGPIVKVVYSPRHLGHAGQLELSGGELVPGFETPQRAEIIRARVEEAGLGPILAPEPFDLASAALVHDLDYLAFLPTVWPRWEAEGRGGTALPFAWPTRALRADRRPEGLDALLGFYSFDAGAGFVEGTWDAARSSYEVAMTAARHVAAGDRAAFALSRPPGHHAGRNFSGGYCYLNNAAIAAGWLARQSQARVAILDIDYHHGNGTQQIFYEDERVAMFSIHADPSVEYPFYLGFADERGAGAGEGFNHNYPLPFGTAWDVWSEALDNACRKIAALGPAFVVVSLGVDTFERDPISRFRLRSDDYPKVGARIARLGLPTLFVMEGGYAVEEIGINAVGVLTGFEDG